MKPLLEETHGVYCDVHNAKVDLSPWAVFRDVRCGWKSNIPICCILFFCVFWKMLYFFISFSIVKKFIYWYPPRTPEGCNYIPCFICFLLRRGYKLYVCSADDVTCCCHKSNCLEKVLE